MDLIRAELAGSWYPGNAKECTREIETFLAAEDVNTPPGEFFAAIVPHAGWFFSGSIACNAIKCLKGELPPDVIVLMGKHLRSTDPATIVTEGSWETPLGNLTVASGFSSRLAEELDLIPESPSRYRTENTIELQLPFIKYFFGNVRIVALGVPPSQQAPQLGASIVETAEAEGLKIKMVGSTDLTHYGPSYGFEPEGSGPGAVEWMKKVNDRSMVETLTTLDAQRVLDEAQANYNACCAGAASALVAAASKAGCTRGELVKYATSFDKNPSDSFVGYAGVVF